MKKFSKKELQEQGKAFAIQLKSEKIIATEDGQFFEGKNKSYAEMHAKEFKLKFYDLQYDLEALNAETKAKKEAESKAKKTAKTETKTAKTK